MNTAKHKKMNQLKSSQLTEKQRKGKYPSIEAASLAKMEAAKEFIDEIDMSLFIKNGHIR